MKRLSPFLILSLVLSQSFFSGFALASSLNIPDDRPPYSNTLPDFVMVDDGADTVEQTTAARNTTANDVDLYKEEETALYIGFEESFDAVSLDYDGAYLSGGAYAYEYWNGNQWTALSGVTQERVQGSTVIRWTMPGNWNTTRVNMDYDEALRSGLSDTEYFIRLRVIDAFTQDGTLDQIGILHYNLIISLEDEAGEAIGDDADSINISGYKTTYNDTKKLGGGRYAYALEYGTDGSSYTYEVAVDGYVTSRKTLSVDKENLTSTLEMPFGYIVALEDDDTSNSVTGADVTAGGVDCVSLGSGEYGCPTPVGGTSVLVTAEKNGYDNLSERFDTLRDSNNDSQIKQTFEFKPDGTSSTDEPDLKVNNLEINEDGELLVTLENAGDASVENGLSVITRIYVDDVLEESFGTTNVSTSKSYLDEGYKMEFNLGSELFGNDDRYEFKVVVDAENDVDESSESNNSLTRTLDTDGSSSKLADLKVKQMEWEDGGDLLVTFENDGEEDSDYGFQFEVEVDEDVLFVYEIQTDGDVVLIEEDGRDRTEEVDSVGSSLDKGDEVEINLGDNILEDEDERYSVRVEVDSDGDIDEEDDDNNELEEKIELGDVARSSGSSSSQDTIESPNCSDYDAPFYDIGASFAECEIEFLYEELEAVQGRTRTSFAPNEKVTRAEFLKMALLGAGYDENDIEDAANGESSPFRDVSSYDWFADYVIFAENEGLIEGYNDGSFHPNSYINRAEALVILMNIADISENDVDFSSGDISFWDVGGYDWYAFAVVKAEEDGLIEGYYDGSFRPSNEITRAETAVLTYRSYVAYFE